MTKSASAKVELTIGDDSGRLFPCTVETFYLSPRWELDFDSPHVGPISYIAGDVFEALRQVRLWLAPQRYIILCNGARIDTWASGMCRSMGGGHKVYLTRMGMRTTFKDLVDTFAAAPRESIGSVKEQEEFNIRWRSSTPRGAG